MNELDILYVKVGLILGVLSVLALYFAYRSYTLITGILRYRRQKIQYPNVLKINESSLCKEPHAWARILLAIRTLPTATYQVCSACGLISGEQYQLNKPGLEVYKNALKIKKEKEEIEKSLQARIDFDLEFYRDKWLESNTQSIIDIVKDGGTKDDLKDVLGHLFKYGIKMNQELLDKISHELTHKQDLDQRYASWGKPR